MELNKILQGNCLEVLRTLPDNSVDCVVTSPPYYGLRNYGSETNVIWGGVEGCDHQWVEKRTPRPNSSGGETTKDYKNNAQHFTDYNDRASYSKTCSICKAWKGQLGLEPTFDLYVEHLYQIFSEIKRILKSTGTCFVNLGDNYAAGGGKGVEQSFKRNKGIDTGAFPDFSPTADLRKKMNKSLILVPFRFAIKMVDNGWIMRNNIIWEKDNSLPTSCIDRFSQNFEYVFFFVKNKKYNFEQQFEPIAESTKVRDKYTRITKGKDGPYAVVHDHETPSNPLGRNKRAIWRIPTRPCREAHFAVMPIDLAEEMIKAGCPKDGVVLDPFMGAGTTAIATTKLKRNWIGIELNSEYIKIAEKRIKKYKLKHRISLDYKGD
jgi:site-specific DNA-methyltransferase (adenine-specific)